MTHPLGERIAEGATAEVYAWEPGWVLKLFRDWASPDWIVYEAGVARAVHASGMPVPAVGDILEIQGRRGITFLPTNHTTYHEKRLQRWCSFECFRVFRGAERKR